MFTIKRTVSISDVDGDGALKLGAMSDFMLACCCFQMDSEKDFSAYLEREHCAVFLASRQIDIIRRPCYGETVTVRTGVFDCMSIFGYRNTFIFDESGVPVIKSFSAGAFVSLDRGRPIRLPDAVRLALTVDEKADMDYLPRKIALPDSAGETMPDFRVRRCQLDANNHMNSSRYLEEAEELIPDNFQYSRVRVEYKHQAKLHARIFPTLFRPAPEKYVVTLNDGDNASHAIVEFSRR
ncbi:MAG: thioesterase [Victivallaceae bacterium]|nr:thioesterase [Victivallaceae bacterium]